MELRIFLSAGFLAVGCFFILVAALGILRFPDFYSRIHPAGKSDTMGQVFVLIGLFIYEGFSFESIKLWLIILFIFIANPTATHAVAKAAYLAGLKPWMGSSSEPQNSEGPHKKKAPSTLSQSGDA